MVESTSAGILDSKLDIDWITLAQSQVSTQSFID